MAEPDPDAGSVDTADDGPVRGRGWWTVGRVTVALVAVVVVALAGIGWTVTYRADQALQANTVQALLTDDPNIATPTAPGSGDAAGQGTAAGSDAANLPAPPDAATIAAMPAENVLILGLDTRPPGEQSISMGTSQSDVIMIAHLSAGRRRVDLLSVPRDLWVPAPVCKAWDYSTNSLSDRDFPNTYAQWKITNAYAVGGPRCTVRAVQALTGLRIDRVIVINFEGFKSVVDALGGVTMTFSGPVVNAGTTIISAAGTQTITGDQALALARARKVAGDPTGDIGRIRRQQQLVAAILTQVASSGMLLDPVRLNSALQTFLTNTSTDNVTLDDLFGLAQSMRSTDTTQVGFHILPTRPDDGTDGLVQAPGNQAIFDALVNDEPYPTTG